MCTYSLRRRLLAMTVVATLGGCSADLTLPGDNLLPTLQAVSGDGQEGIVGSQLPDPLIAHLADGAGQPLAGVSVQFQSDVPTAEIKPATTETDDSGFVSVRVRLGTTAGTQTIVARVAEDTTGDLRTIFGLTALAKNRHPGHGDEGHGKGEHEKDHD
jgi:ABC-type phosphate transport system substrate-binding protein